MKKITILAVAALAISFASCKKDRTCTCTHTPSSGTSYTTKTTMYKVKKDHAAQMCIGEQTVTEAGGTTSTGTKSECTLD
ncbi:MAG TPA: hypothetical protein PLC65_06370 [Bacteroidia bacterium]|nr:hypothetical protein [Bacteroidia bacterium]HRD38238.1 hypothetical protein [Bacteroidia bacterium]